MKIFFLWFLQEKTINFHMSTLYKSLFIELQAKQLFYCNAHRHLDPELLTEWQGFSHATHSYLLLSENDLIKRQKLGFVRSVIWNAFKVNYQLQTMITFKCLPL